MADPYLIVAYWAQPAPSYDKLARMVVPQLGDFGLPTYLTTATQTHFFDDARAAAEWLTNNDGAIILQFVIEFPAGVSLATTNWGRSETIIELALSSADTASLPAQEGREALFTQIRTLACAFVSEAGARFVWLTRIPGDVDGVSDLIEAFDLALAGKSTSPISLDKMSYAGWLFMWSSGSDAPPIQTAENVRVFGNAKYVELINDRPIDLEPGWVTSTH
jgi:hypothetical protein